MGINFQGVIKFKPFIESKLDEMMLIKCVHSAVSGKITQIHTIAAYPDVIGKDKL